MIVKIQIIIQPATYSVSSNTAYQYYTVHIDTDKNGILVTDLNNNIKSKFTAGEKFKSTNT